MDNSNVIVRFMSLLDVALILLGVLMLALMQTAVPTPSGAGDPLKPVKDQINFIYLFAGWKSEQNGRCFELNEKMEIGNQVSMISDSDIETLRDIKGLEQRAPAVAILVFEEDGWFPAWSPEKIAGAEKVWGIKVIPVYDVSFQNQFK